MTVLAGISRDDAGCECRRCLEDWRKANAGNVDIIGGSFVVCPICGNKRCPKATWHENACTESNAPGQEGSDYA